MPSIDITKYEMSPYDNVLYFPNNIDVRLCPKNGMSSIKEIFRIHKGHEEFVGRTYRYRRVTDMADQFSLPFRKNSFRIAVRRDPLDRFKSACEYIMRERAEHIRSGRPHDLPDISSDIEKVISDVEAGALRNNHFYTQSWYMGHPSDYDMVVHIDELDRLICFLDEACELGLTEEQLNTRVNQSKFKLYNDGLTALQQLRVQKLYEKDYKNGWCKQQDVDKDISV